MSQMQTAICKLFGLDKQTADLGVEIEAEGTPLPFVDATGRWSVVEEASLRGYGVEFVSRPFRIYDLGLWMETWKEMTKGAWFKPSWRTSVHVHVNVTDWTLKDVLTALTAYWIIEDELVRQHGKIREGNLHCLRLSDANAQVINLIQDLYSNQLTCGPSTDNEYRYSAANLASLKKHGTIEFRFLKGMTDPKEIEQWVAAIYHLMMAARTLYKSPRNVLGTFQRVPLEYFLNGLLPEWVVKQMSPDRDRYVTNLPLLGRLAKLVTELSRPAVPDPDLIEE